MTQYDPEDDVARAPMTASPDHDTAGGDSGGPADLDDGQTVTVSGRVRHLMQTSEGSPPFETTIIQFRLDRVGAHGGSLPPVSVEMRGRQIAGRVADDEEVTVTGTVRYGILHTRELTNVTTRSQVREDPKVQGTARPARIALVVVGGLVVLIFLVVIAGALGFLGANAPSGPPRAAAPSTAPPDPVVHQVSIGTGTFGTSFSPEQLDLRAGDSVRFRNTLATGCRLTADFGDWPPGDSTVPAGGDLTVKFPAAGMFGARCGTANAPPLTVSVLPS